MSSRRRAAIALIVSMLVPLAPVGGSAHAEATCAGPAAGGEWRMFGQDLTGRRSQGAETSISSDDVGDLASAWTFSTGGGGTFNATPVVADGCVYIGSSTGTLHALNAETGDVVWGRDFEFEEPGLGGAFVSSVAVADGRVFAHISDTGQPYVVALDAATGAIEWESDVVENDPRARMDASVVHYDGLLFVGMTGGDAQPDRNVPLAILDAETGEILEVTPVIPPEDFEEGYAGGGIWATAAVDTESGHAFVGTANPYSKRKEHRRTNAILKIDLDDSRDTFGEIVDGYKGDVDQYFPGLDRQPVCQTFGDNPLFHYPVPGQQGFSLACFQLDIDFGASPNLFTDSRGNLLVGELQKSGVYHVAHAETMQRAWTALVSWPSAAGNSATSAVGDDGVYVSGLPGMLYSLDKDTGGYNWAAPIPGGGLYQALSVANGVVYGLDASGSLNAYDAETGLLLLRRPMAADTGSDTSALSSSGIAIARNTVYTAMADSVVAYSVPE